MDTKSKLLEPIGDSAEGHRGEELVGDAHLHVHRHGVHDGAVREVEVLGGEGLGFDQADAQSDLLVLVILIFKRELKIRVGLNELLAHVRRAVHEPIAVTRMGDETPHILVVHLQGGEFGDERAHDLLLVDRDSICTIHPFLMKYKMCFRRLVVAGLGRHALLRDRVEVPVVITLRARGTGTGRVSRSVRTVQV